MGNKIVSLIQKLKFVTSYIFHKNFSELDFLKSIVNEKSTIIDIGSNLGNFISFIKRVDKKAQVLSIEPNLDLIMYQKKKFRRHSNINFFNMGINSYSKLATFYIRNPISHSSFLKNHPDEEFNKIVKTTKIKVETLDNFLKKQNIEKITLLKIDTEGLDYEILLSLKNLLLNKKIEFIKIEANKDTFEKIISFANDQNLKLVGFSDAFYFRNRLVMMDIYLKNENLFIT